MAGSRRNLYCRGSSVLQYSGVQGFKTVLQYTALYCGWKGCRRQGCIVIQPGVLWQETGCLCRKAGSCVATRRWAWALGARAGQICALGALGLFSTRFDSVLFLSQFLDIVREPSS